MLNPRSDFLRVLTERGFIHQCTDAPGLDRRAKPIVAYVGYDCTAPSLHVGSLVSIMMLRWLQKTGHKPIVLLGGGTSKVGDPSGKDETRGLLSDAEIARNMAGIERVFARFLTFGDGASEAMAVNNADWLDRLDLIAFLRDYGRHFSVNRMLSFDSVRLRLERDRPLSFLEFNYMVLQAFDFLELHRRFDCILQMGGSDQWGNIVNGVDLIRRLEGHEAFGLTTPLITTAGGAKMGKTAEGAIWLGADLLSPYAYWQYWRNCDDADVGRFLRLFTELPLSEIARLEKLEGADRNEAKKILASAATALCHGAAAAEAAAETARLTFEEGEIGAALPCVSIDRRELDSGIAAFQLFHRAGLSATATGARKLIRGGGTKINDAPLKDEMRKITLADVTPEGVVKLSAGKKRHVILRPV
jgi:tyrosyl-tRNA synthetase